MFAAANKRFLLFALMFAVLLVHAGIQHKAILNEKTKRQDVNLRNLERDEVSFSAVQDVFPMWQAAFAPIDKIKDTLSLYHLVRFDEMELKIKAEDIRIKGQVKRYQRNNQDIGLTQICMATKSSNGFEVRSTSMPLLLKGIRVSH